MPEEIMEAAKSFLMEHTKQGSPKGRKPRPQEALAKVRRRTRAVSASLPSVHIQHVQLLHRMFHMRIQHRRMA